jgi:tRNA(Arg) A34 adenosine deaminase TadA
MNITLLFEAAKFAIGSNPNDKRSFILGAFGERGKDNKLVKARNGAVSSSVSSEKYRIIGEAHAEIRLLQKLGHGGTIYVARILKRDGLLAMAKPCGGCQVRIKAAKVKKVYYSVNYYQYGVWEVEKDYNYICSFSSNYLKQNISVIQ